MYYKITVINHDCVMQEFFGKTKEIVSNKLNDWIDKNHYSFDKAYMEMTFFTDVTEKFVNRGVK